MKSFLKISALITLALATVSATPGGQDMSPVPQADLFARADNDTVGNDCEKLDDYSPEDSLDVSPSYDAERAELMRYRFHIGVNLGSWFVTEKWMNPSLFKCARKGEKGELAIPRSYGTSSDGIKSARARLEKHWDTWVTKDDFADLKKKGVNAVRIPIGYWNLPEAKFLKDTPFENYTEVYKNSWKYVRRAIKYANDNDIGVMLDLHGAYGSQNGEEKSGYNKFDIDFYKGDNRNRTTEALSWIVRDLQEMPNMIGLELLNEAKNDGDKDLKRLLNWYKNALDTIRAIGGTTEDFPLYISDSFSPDEAADMIQDRSDFVVSDTHRYFAFTNDHQSAKEITNNVETSVKKSMRDIADKVGDRYVIGEWSCALDPESTSSKGSKKMEELSDFCDAQISTYRNVTAGMFFWSYRFEDCDDNMGWCFKAARGKFFDKYNAWGFENKDKDEVVGRVKKENLDSQHKKALQATSPDPRDLGYAHGFQWAKKLAVELPVSRLGFKDEYIDRRIEKNDDKLSSKEDKKEYREGFQDGVNYIECIVLSYKNDKSDSVCNKHANSSKMATSSSTSNSTSSSSKSSSSSSSSSSKSSSSSTSSSSSSQPTSTSSSSSSQPTSTSSSSSSQPTSTSSSSSSQSTSTSSSKSSSSKTSTLVTSSVSGTTVTATATGTPGGQMCGNDNVFGISICIDGSANDNNISN